MVRTLNIEPCTLTFNSCSFFLNVEHSRTSLNVERFPEVIILNLIGIALFGYIIGSLPTGYLIGRAKGIDIFQHGSGNIGATNVWRTFGPALGLLAFAGDAGKGVLSVYVGSLYGEWPAVVAAACALLGHSWSIFLRFKGGKIMATALGVFIMLTPNAAFVSFGIWALVLLLSRYVSLSSITAAVSLPVMIAAFGYHRSYVLFSALAAVVAVYKHRGNIKRLLNGTEQRMGR